MARKTSSKARRLSPEQKAEILRLHAEGQSKKAIAEALQTSAPTVGRTITDAQSGSPTTLRTRRAGAEATMPNSNLTKRLKALAVTVGMDGSVDEDEKSSLK